VWLDLDQQALDEAYDQSVYAPNMQQVIGRYATNSEAARRRLGTARRLAYGPTPKEALDLYAAARSNAPINVFVHGGAWRAGSATDYAFLAELFTAAGANFIALDFINVLETDGDLRPMVEQVRRAIAWVYENARSFAADPDRLYVSGHSSGAHLVGVALVTDWSRAFNLPANLIKGALCCSGLFDLKPVRLSARSNYIKFTDETERSFSPLRYVGSINCPLLLAHGTLETPEFQRQTRDFAAAVRQAGKEVGLLVGEGYNHFEILETLANPHGILGRAVLEQMGLA
jgi:arylformamidase